MGNVPRRVTAWFALAIVLWVGTALAQQPEDLVGRWATNGEHGVSVEFRADGTAMATEGGGSFPFNWSVDFATSPGVLTLDLEGDIAYAFIRFEGADAFGMTEPNETLPEQGMDDVEVIVFQRIGATPPAETPPEDTGELPSMYERLGLDLSTPAAAAETFARAAAAHDGLLVHFVLDPRSRGEIRQALRMYDAEAIFAMLGGAPAGAEIEDVMAALEPLTVEESLSPDHGLMVIEFFPLTEALFRYAAEHGLTPVPLTGEDDFSADPILRIDADGLTLADLPVARSDGSTAEVHLLQSPGGLWRVLGVSFGPEDARVSWMRTAP